MELQMILDQLSGLTQDAAALEPWSLTGAEVREVVGAVQQTRTALDALMCRLAASADAMGLPKDDGAPSVTAWLASTTGMPKADAAKLAALARSTSSAETTRAAWAAGEISTDQAKVIMQAIDRLPEWVGEQERTDAEAHLIELAGRHHLDDLRRLANRVLEVIDPDGADEVLGEQVRREEEKAWEATRLTIKRRGDGTTRGTFLIPDADADTLRAAIEGIIAPRRAAINAARRGLDVGDFNALPRDQRMGHAFVELIEHLPTGALPQSGGLAATVAVTVDVDDLRTGRGTATNTSGTTTSARKAQRLACNARLVALYLDSESKVLDLGTTRRIYDRHQRLALAVRDKGCVFPDCDRPPAWCEAHHLNFWAEGGPTDLDNAALLCHFHHFLLHEGEWTARMAPDGVIEVIPPRRVDPEQRPRRHARFTKQRPRAA
ncbi:HNH endonuclease signature motif containing protein [Aeromicrobium chenweiae]|uniref:HNH endonuclease signature motif containing protein n=1 Tax=Aeromicrobium chenweiae TaxID=2079793 RepID=UPI00131F1625|nr:HNH endonuclease signature motif containing protein [Aeromicrobium chenweiae]